MVRRRRAGRPQRSEDRTGPATSGGGRRPPLTRGRKVLTNCYRVLTVIACSLLSRAHDLRSCDPWFGCPCRSAAVRRLAGHGRATTLGGVAAQALHGTLCATDRRSGCRPVLVTWLGQSNSRARMPAVNAVHSIGLKVSAGPVGSKFWLPGPPCEAG